MSDHNERACIKCGSLTHHEDDCTRREPQAARPTPRTDEEALPPDRFLSRENVVPAGFARQLERELSEAKEKPIITEVICGTDHSFELSKNGTLDALRKQLADAKAVQDRAMRYLTQAMGSDVVEGCPLDEATALLVSQRDNAKAEVAYWEGEAERERNQRQKEVGMQEYRGNTVSYMYDKAKCYGDMVHGCSPAIAAAGFPVDENAPDGQVGAIARSVQEMSSKLAAHSETVRRLCDMLSSAGHSAVDYVGAANYRERQEEAHNNIDAAYEKALTLARSSAEGKEEITSPMCKDDTGPTDEQVAAKQPPRQRAATDR